MSKLVLFIGVVPGKVNTYWIDRDADNIWFGYVDQHNLIDQMVRRNKGYWNEHECYNDISVSRVKNDKI